MKKERNQSLPFRRKNLLPSKETEHHNPFSKKFSKESQPIKSFTKQPPYDRTSAISTQTSKRPKNHNPLRISSTSNGRRKNVVHRRPRPRNGRRLTLPKL